MLRCSFVGNGSYTSAALGLVQEHGIVVGSEEFVRQHVPTSFFNIEPVRSWRVDHRLSLGDKLYLVPCLYRYKSEVGIHPRDEVLFRMVSDKIRPYQKEDVCCIKASLPELMRFRYRKGISEVVARMLRTELAFNMPILETLPEEKEKALNEFPERYIVACGSANDTGRCWESLPFYLQKNLDFPVMMVNERSPVLFSMIEGAELVVSVNTSVIPMAGGFQVPGIAVSSSGMVDKVSGGSLKFRTKPFLEWDVLEGVSDIDVLEATHSFLGRDRLHCWCGAQSDSRFVLKNLRFLKCSKCGTVRQDVKLSQRGLMQFYSSMYDPWREVVEKENPYYSRFDHDVFISTLRLGQWGFLEGSSWLDVGSGNGALIEVLRSKGWDSVGLECSKRSYPIVGWENAGKYDVISFVDVLEHFIDPVKELKLALAHLSEKGLLVIELPNAFENPVHFRRLQHIFYFDERTFEKLIFELNLKVVRKLKPIPGKLSYILGRKI